MTTIADWEPTADQPPDVRVGIVLPQDDTTRLRLAVPDAPYDLTGGVEAPRLVGASTLEFRTADDGVRVTADRQELGTTLTWSIRPRRESEDDIAPAIRVGDVAAGRGFHWETRAEQSLPGRLTVRCIDGRLQLVCRLPLEAYLLGVITSEMSGDCPAALLEAQCVVARSWTLAAAERKHAGLGIDVCNDDCCQRYQGVSGVTDLARSAVRRTRGQVLMTEQGGLVDANYSKCCGGIVEDPKHVWGRPKPGLTALADAPAGSALRSFLPVTEANVEAYLSDEGPAAGDAYCGPSSVSDSALKRYLGRVDRGGGFFRWTVTYRRAELEDILGSKCFLPADFAELTGIEVTKRGTSGRATEVILACQAADGRRSTVTIRGQHLIRQALHRQFLFSSVFRVRVEGEAEGRGRRFHFDGAGWGHGAGLCQIGALGMALAGHDCRAILAHYFPTARLQSVYA